MFLRLSVGYLINLKWRCPGACRAKTLFKVRINEMYTNFCFPRVYLVNCVILMHPDNMKSQGKDILI